MSSNFRQNERLSIKIFLLIGNFTIALNFSNYSHAHVKGMFSSEQDAVKRSLEIGCEGIHKNQDKWLPCENEKELHKFLRK